MPIERPRHRLTRRQILAASGTGLAAGLAGCSGGDGGGGDGGATDTPTSGDGGGGDGGSTDTPTSTSGDGGDGGGSDVELTAWTWTLHGPPLEELAKRYGATVNVTNLPQSAGDEKLVTALQAQTNLPSITLIRSQVLKNVARNGGMLNLDDFMAENGDVLFPVAKTRNPVDGHWYSFPNDLGPYALMYNADMFEEAGLPTDRETLEEEIQTWDDFIEAGEQFKRDTGNDLITFQTSSAANGLPRAMMTQAGGAYYNDDGEFQFDQEANVRAMEKLQEMNDRINTSIQWLSSQFWDAFRKENVAVMAGAAWMVGFTKQNLPDMEGKWRVMRMPSLGGDTPRAANFGGVGAGIPLAVDSNEQEAAKEFGKYWHLSEDSFNVKLDLGVFPAHYIEGAEQATATDPYFGGQNRNEVFIQSAQDCPPQYPHPNPRALELGRESYRLILQEGEDVAETLTSINEQMLEAIPEEEKTTGGTSG